MRQGRLVSKLLDTYLIRARFRLSSGDEGDSVRASIFVAQQDILGEVESRRRKPSL
jgi:hypothetical protein